MSNHISEEGPRQGHAAGDTSVEQQASQLASDIKYKARQKMKQTSGSSLSPAQVQALYRQLLNASPAPGAVKSIVKKKLFSEQVDCGAEIVSETVKGSKSNVFGKIFVEGGGQKVEDVIEEDVDQKFIVRVTDKATGNTSYRKADRAKIAQLRANPNISSVEITGRKKADDAYDSEKSGGKKAKKDYDGDGKIESGTAEYMGSRDKAIKKAMAKEEFIADAKEEDKEDKKLDVMKGKNEIKINPALGESIRVKLDALKAQRVEEAMNAAKEAGPSAEEKRQLMNKDRMLKKKIMMQKQTMQMQKQGKLPLNYSEGSECAEGEMKNDKKKEGEEDPRSMPAKINLAKNKLRAMGLRMSYDMEGEVVNEEDYDRMKDRRMERGGVAGNVDYRRPPKSTNTEFGKKKSSGMSALDYVKAEIRKKHGDKAIIDTKKK